LANALNSKVSSLASASTSQSGKILLSIKLQEIDDAGKVNLEKILSNSSLTFDVFLHASEGSDLENRLLKRAQKVFAASAEIGEEIKSRRPDVVNLFAPGAPISAVSKQTEISLLTFGMAHKISATGYRKLAKILATSNRSFQLEVSSALHEGTSFDENFFSVADEISQSFRWQCCLSRVSRRPRSLAPLTRDNCARGFLSQRCAREQHNGHERHGSWLCCDHQFRFTESELD